MKKETRELHGKTKTKEYSSWDHMIQRCTNPNNTHYKYYGGRGIRVSDAWRESFSKFYEDMGECPDGYSLDRINPNGDYCFENCRWVDKTTQQYNQNIRSDNSSGVTGVRWDKRRSRWKARINFKNVEIHLGYFLDFETACEVRKLAEIFYYGTTK